MMIHESLQIVNYYQKEDNKLKIKF